MKKETKWLVFAIKKFNPKTKVYSVISKHSHCEIGEIKWYGRWRHYCFFPTIEFEVVYSDRCLLDIGNFVKQLNEDHKNVIHRN